MKKILVSLFILFMPVCLWSGGVLFMAGGVEEAGGLTYYHQFLLEQAYETTKVRDEVTDSNIGAITGDVVFASGCSSNGADFDGNADYIEFTAAELSNVPNWNKGRIRFSYMWDGTNQRSHIFYLFAGGDGPRLEWRPGDSDWQFTLYEGSSVQLTAQWENSDAASGTCEYYEIAWAFNTVESLLDSTLELYKGVDFDNLALQTRGTSTLNEGAGTVENADGFRISQNSSTQACVGLIGDFYIVDPN